MSTLDVKISRYRYAEKSTQGTLFVNDGQSKTGFAGHILENPWLGNEPEISCIPTGVYRLGLRKEGGWHNSALVKKRIAPTYQGMIEVLDVPGRTFILMHWGNWPKNTKGCPLIGTTAGVDSVGASIDAYLKFYARVVDHLVNQETVMLRIEDM